MKSSLDSYRKPKNSDEVKHELNEIADSSAELYTSENLIKCFGFMDLTTLNTTDGEKKVKGLCSKINELQKYYPQLPNISAIYVYPNLIDIVKNNLQINTISIGTVAGGFPSAQTFTEIKVAETKRVAEKGAGEIDVMLSVGAFLEGHYQMCSDELKELKKVCGNAKMNVILETGALVSIDNIWKASLLAMEAGADFIKTSTSKFNPSATMEAALIMAEAIKEYYSKSGRKVGFKAAGGITSGSQAIDYYAVIEKILGDVWLNSSLFRIGGNSLANNILEELQELETGEDEEVKYF